MAWFRIDDKLPDNRKARAVRKSHRKKRRDVSPFGLWAVAGAWSDDGWVPLEWLEDWDDDAEEMAERLVDAGLWHATERDGEPGYVFHDWHDQNPSRDDSDPSATGTFGNHVRWHVQRKIIAPDCGHCPTEPYPAEVSDDGAKHESADDLHERPEPHLVTADALSAESPRSSADDLQEREPGGYLDSSAESLPSRPVPTRTRPEPEPLPRPSGRETQTPERFEEFWDTYAHKVGRKKAETAYRAALKKPGVTDDLLIASAAAYIEWQQVEGKHPQFTKHPATWLHGEHWNDERVTRRPPQTRVQEHLTLVQQLAAEEAEQERHAPRQIGGNR